MNKINHESMMMEVLVDGVAQWRAFEYLVATKLWAPLPGPAPVTRDGERRDQLVDGTWVIHTEVRR